MSDPSLGDLAEFLNVVIQTQSRLDTVWMLFLSINSTIIGAVILIKRKFNLFEKAVAICVYSVLTLLNLLVMHNIVKQLNALYTDLEILAFEKEQTGHHIIKYLTSFNDIDTVWANMYFIPIVYLCFYCFTVFCLICDEKLTVTEDEK